MPLLVGPTTHVIRLSDTQVNGVDATAASAEVTMLSRAGTELPGYTWPVAMVEADGDYIATVDAETLVLVAGRTYRIQVDATFAGGVQRRFILAEVAQDG